MNPENDDRMCAAQTQRPLKTIICHLDHLVIRGLIDSPMMKSLNQSMKIYVAPFKIPTQRRSRLRLSGNEQSSEAGGIEDRHRLGGALNLREVLELVKVKVISRSRAHCKAGLTTA